MINHQLPFEQPIAEMEKKSAELRAFSRSQGIDVSRELTELENRILQTKREIYGNLKAWDEVQLARHPQRPFALDYIEDMCGDFIELHGDRYFADDHAVIGGFARLGEEKIMVLGTQKGRDVKSNVQRNFGMAHPEGYRKALRLMKLAVKFGCPIVTLVDTAGAYPGIGSEERHIAEAIAVNLRESFLLPVPVIVVIIGEGGSGGALGIGVGDRIMILEHAYYSVISPEGCAAILWNDRTFADKAAESLKLTSRDLLKAGLVDEVVPEPLGGAHRDRKAVADNLKSALLKSLRELKTVPIEELLERRYEKFRAMGCVVRDTSKEEEPENAEPDIDAAGDPDAPEPDAPDAPDAPVAPDAPADDAGVMRKDGQPADEAGGSDEPGGSGEEDGLLGDIPVREPHGG